MLQTREPGLFDDVDTLQHQAHAPRSALPLSGTQEQPITPEPTPEERRDQGIKSAVEHADAVEPKWSVQADIYARNWLRRHGDAPFLMEDIVEDARSEGFPMPVEMRAWGSVIRKLARDKAVLKEGAAVAKTSNLSFKVLWKRNPDWKFQ